MVQVPLNPINPKHRLLAPVLLLKVLGSDRLDWALDTFWRGWIPKYSNLLSDVAPQASLKDRVQSFGLWAREMLGHVATPLVGVPVAIIPFLDIII